MRALSGKCILVGRARPGRSQIATALRAAGAAVLEAPRVTVSDYPFLSPIATALSDRTRCEGVVFGCAAGVDVAVRHRLLQNCSAPILAVGDAAATALRRQGIEPEAVFDGACSRELSACRTELGNKRLILLASDRGRPSLVAELSPTGASIETVPVYQSHETFPDLFPIPNAVVLPSSSAAQLLLSISFWGFIEEFAHRRDRRTLTPGGSAPRGFKHNPVSGRHRRVGGSCRARVLRTSC
jgi:uroporphyrinogen-III synthase